MESGVLPLDFLDVRYQQVGWGLCSSDIVRQDSFNIAVTVENAHNLHGPLPRIVDDEVREHGPELHRFIRKVFA